MPKLTEEEAQGMLKQLAEHYDQPVMPVRKFCGALTAWFRCIEDLNHSCKEAGIRYPTVNETQRVLSECQTAYDRSIEEEMVEDDKR